MPSTVDGSSPAASSRSTSAWRTSCLTDERDERVVLARAHDHDRRVSGDDRDVDAAVVDQGPGARSVRHRSEGDVGVERVQRRGQRGAELGGVDAATGFERDVVPRRPRVEHVGEDHGETRSDEQDPEHDPERTAPKRLSQLAPRHQLRRLQPGHATSLSPAASRKSSERLGASTPKSSRSCVTPDLVEHLPGIGVRCEPDPGAAGVDGTTVAPDPSIHVGSTVGVDPQPPIGALRLQGPQIALQDDAPVVEQRDRLAEVLDEVELVAGEEEVAHRRACAR